MALRVKRLLPNLMDNCIQCCRSAGWKERQTPTSCPLTSGVLWHGHYEWNHAQTYTKIHGTIKTQLSTHLYGVEENISQILSDHSIST